MSNCLLIFTRNPELGKVKSRLAQGVGQENALAIYKKLLQHTQEVVTQVNCERWVGYSVIIRTNDLWPETDFKKFKQEGTDLGKRMSHAFETAFAAGHTKVIIVGSDLYDLRPTHLEEAFTALQKNDVVLGPAQDGGYYLLGMKSLIPEVFSDKEWGTETVYKDTLDNLQTKSVHLLEMLNDIDYAQDLEPYSEFKQYL